jgi:hypothetical protein
LSQAIPPIPRRFFERTKLQVTNNLDKDRSIDKQPVNKLIAARDYEELVAKKKGVAWHIVET